MSEGVRDWKKFGNHWSKTSKLTENISSNFKTACCKFGKSGLTWICIKKESGYIREKGWLWICNDLTPAAKADHPNRRWPRQQTRNNMWMLHDFASGKAYLSEVTQEDNYLRGNWVTTVAPQRMNVFMYLSWSVFEGTVYNIVMEY